MPTNSVYCHKSHSHFALLIAQKIFAIILRLPLILFVSFARLSAWWFCIIRRAVFLKCDIEMKNKEEFLKTDRSVLVVRDYLAKGLWHSYSLNSAFLSIRLRSLRDVARRQAEPNKVERRRVVVSIHFRRCNRRAASRLQPLTSKTNAPICFWQDVCA